MSTNTSVDATTGFLIYYYRCYGCPAVQLGCLASIELKREEPDSLRTVRGIVESVGDAGIPVHGADDRRADMRRSGAEQEF